MAIKKPHKAGPGRPFKKGQSGNPGGLPKTVAEVRQVARQWTTAAIDTLVEVMQDKSAPAASRVMAASTILDRGHGKAPQHVSVTETPLDKLDPATLAALAAALEGAEELVAGGDEGTTRH